MARLPLLIPITDLRQDAASIVGKVQNSPRPVVITQRGRAAAVLLSVEAYERGEIEREMLRLLIRGEREIKQGKGDSLDDVLAQADQLIQEQNKP